MFRRADRHGNDSALDGCVGAEAVEVKDERFTVLDGDQLVSLRDGDCSIEADYFERGLVYAVVMAVVGRGPWEKQAEPKCIGACERATRACAARDLRRHVGQISPDA